MSLREPSPSQVWRWFSTALRSDPERHAPVPQREAEARSFDPRPRLQELLHSPALCGHDAVLRQMTPERVDQLRALPDQKIPRPEQHGARLLSPGLNRDKAHRRSTGSLSDRFRVGGIVLLALDERFDVDGW